eukprot:scaffold195309_cov32-Tisochrysis_lutea.AAC.3
MEMRTSVSKWYFTSHPPWKSVRGQHALIILPSHEHSVSESAVLSLSCGCEQMGPSPNAPEELIPVRSPSIAPCQRCTAWPAPWPSQGLPRPW